MGDHQDHREGGACHCRYQHLCPKIKKVGVIMEIDCEVHHDVFEESTSEVTVDIERKEDVIHDRIHVNEGEMEPIIETSHEWDRTQIPPEFATFVLPEFGDDGCIVQNC